MSSAIGSFAAIVAFFIISKRLEQDILWRRYRYFSIVVAFVAIVVSVVGVGLLGALGVPGLAQRLFMAVLFFWIEVMGIRLLQISG